MPEASQELAGQCNQGSERERGAPFCAYACSSSAWCMSSSCASWHRQAGSQARARCCHSAQQGASGTRSYAFQVPQQRRHLPVADWNVAAARLLPELRCHAVAPGCDLHFRWARLQRTRRPGGASSSSRDGVARSGIASALRFSRSRARSGARRNDGRPALKTLGCPAVLCMPHERRPTSAP